MVGIHKCSKNQEAERCITILLTRTAWSDFAPCPPSCPCFNDLAAFLYSCSWMSLKQVSWAWVIASPLPLPGAGEKENINSPSFWLQSRRANPWPPVASLCALKKRNGRSGPPKDKGSPQSTNTIMLQWVWTRCTAVPYLLALQGRGLVCLLWVGCFPISLAGFWW